MAVGSPRGSSDHFDLLPFINVLMCTLASLLLVTMSMAAIQLGPEVKEGWVPDTSRSTLTLTPVLIEWDGRSLAVHWPDRQPRILEIPWDDSPTAWPKIRWDDSPTAWSSDDGPQSFDSLIHWFAQRQTSHYALFAVRPSGFDDFQRVVDRFRASKIKVGYEPVAQDRKIRLRLNEETR